MYKKLLFLVAMPFLLNAGNLTLTQGEIIAHTKVFGDSNIKPGTNIIKVEATMEGTIESLKGTFSIKSADLKSTKTDRDEHMYETLEVAQYPDIIVDIQSISKISEQYKLNGSVTLHGVSQPLNTIATITKDANGVSLKGGFAVKMTDHSIKPPKLLFLTVGNRIDITYDLQLK